MRRLRFNWLNLAIASALVVISVSVAVTYRGDYRWIGHAVIAAVALITLAGMTTTGRRLARTRDPRGAALFRQHITIAVFFAILVIGTFVYGILVSLGEEELLWGNSPHAWLGAAIIVLALAQLIPSLVMKRTATVRFYHRIIGYSLITLVLAQIALGVYMVLTGS